MRLLTLLALSSSASLALAQEPRRVTLDEALRRAALNQPVMVQARQDVRVASAQERQAFGAFLPTISTNLSTSKSGSERIDATSGRPVSTGIPYNDQLGLNASLELFTGFRRGANRRAASATTGLREATQLRQEYAVALSTKQAFFNALAAAELVAVAETRLRRADEQLKLTSEKLRLGATTRSDSLRGRVEYGNAQLQLIQARADLRNAQSSLGRAIGLEGEVAPVPDTALEARLGALDTAALRREALAYAPSVREAEASVASARASLSASRAAYLPTLTATGSSSWARADSAFLGGAPFTRSWSLRLQLSYPIFNGFTRETNIVTADANATAAEARLRDARLALDASLNQVFAALEAAAAKIDVARVSVAAAEEDLRMQRERYRLGSSTIIEVLSSQVALDQAQVDLVRARYDYLIARAQIEALVGHAL
ncbi:MAG: TolC family protein [Gemmatimonadetes bacterium]|nr:TolC family protein [Gemmatimonadota bacterium]